ncbi:CynX/NimT family MFS transporter [Staphylococcus simiae]|uniref:Putative transporter n=1 Tax=Staphylococcus simiae CCM 7213 = CCUG 51256 TaxID=911238 RepID=G5JIE7_9STAP|nr:MFS transporter [Staphylococcus simiae]EHJ08038.1 putative transporter [Staphylococcus simiae CCM 7213 = CCUG 51256]PNZ14559.1 MFS transporter [Staphylococcus simiae]SNV58065.1 transporter [Staphylococcus simiae]
MEKDLQANNKINWLLFIGILLIGANLRAPITSVGVALPSIKDALHLNNIAVSIITIIPLIAFAIISLFAAKTSNTFGIERTLFGALIIILVGVIIRSLPNVSGLYIGTIFIGIGIAFGNVLTPAIIKAKFPLRIGIMTGYYTVVMNIFGSLSSYSTGPLVKAFNYQIALGIIGIITLIATLIWVFQLNHKNESTTSKQVAKVNIWKSSIAWRITLLMGGQSLIFYSIINWMPAYLADYGVSINEAGLYLSILQLAIIPLTFITPIWATKMTSQVPLVLLTGIMFIAGTLAMLFLPQIALISILLLGIANGLSFGLVNTFFSLKTEESSTAAKLSGMSQSIGYLFAAIGPFLFGSLHDATHSWIASIMILVITSLAILIFSTSVGRNITIEQHQLNK